MIVVGGGIAGMYAALCAAAETDVVLLTKGPLLTSASYLAQGGVAAAALIDTLFAPVPADTGVLGDP